MGVAQKAEVTRLGQVRASLGWRVKRRPPKLSGKRPLRHAACWWGQSGKWGQAKLFDSRHHPQGVAPEIRGNPRSFQLKRPWQFGSFTQARGRRDGGAFGPPLEKKGGQAPTLSGERVSALPTQAGRLCSFGLPSIRGWKPLLRGGFGFAGVDHGFFDSLPPRILVSITQERELPPSGSWVQASPDGEDSRECCEAFIHRPSQP